MLDTIIKSEHILCTCCMEEHNVLTVEVLEKNIFKGEEVVYKAIYNYCENTEEYFESGDMIGINDIAMKNEYRRKFNLLTTDEICKIREKYGISQSDLCLILGWGAKTITRYESHQIQDKAHDTILRKIDSDPEWFITLLNENGDKITSDSYNKYLNAAKSLFEKCDDSYLRKSIKAQYARFDKISCGNTELNIDKVIDVVSYLANSSNVVNLYKVKLMKLLWYIDNLSFKMRNYSMTGLVYRAQDRGAVPVAHQYLMELDGIHYEDIEFEEGTGYKFTRNDNTKYATLTAEDKEIIDIVIHRFGGLSKNQIVEIMHKEDAYIETALHDIIQYKYAESLSIG